MEALLKKGLAKLGLDSSGIPSLLRYGELLLEKNKVMNLTAITEPADIATLHFLDSAALLTLADMKGKTVFMAINAEAILDLPVVKMLVGFGGKEFKTYSDLASKVSYLSVSSEGETSETDLCLKDKDVNALKQIVDFAKQFAGM